MMARGGVLASLLVAGCVLLMGAFAAGYLARYVHPARAFWLQPLGTLLPLLSLLLLVVPLVGLGTGRRWLLIPAVLLIAAALVRFVPIRWFDRPVAAGPVLRVTTYNAHFRYEPDFEGRTPLEAMTDALKPLTSRTEPHLLALQEQRVQLPLDRMITNASGNRAFLNHAHLLGILAGTPFAPDAGAFEAAPRAGAPNEYVNPVLFSGVEADSVEKILRRPNEDWRVPPLATRLVFQWEGRTVALYNVHLHSFEEKFGAGADEGDGGLRARLRRIRADYRRRADEAARLRARLDAEPYPFIVAGDFNATRHNWSYAHVAHGLTDAVRRAGSGWTATYHSRLPLLRIDHVLVSPDWQVHAARPIPLRLSDHRPLSAVVSLRPAP